MDFKNFKDFSLWEGLITSQGLIFTVFLIVMICFMLSISVLMIVKNIGPFTLTVGIAWSVMSIALCFILILVSNEKAEIEFKKENIEMKYEFPGETHYNADNGDISLTVKDVDKGETYTLDFYFDENDFEPQIFTSATVDEKLISSLEK